jgi:hypothetical protein
MIRRFLAVVLVALIVGSVMAMRNPAQWTIRDDGVTSWSVAFDRGDVAYQWTSITKPATPTSEEATVVFGFDRDMNRGPLTITGGMVRGWPGGQVHCNRFGLLVWTQPLPSACRATWSAPRTLRWQYAVGGSAFEAGVVRILAWPMALLLAAYPLWSGVRGFVLRRKRRKNGLCMHCGYDLTGNESGTCSECGTSK